jgi:hypothetical protein
MIRLLHRLFHRPPKEPVITPAMQRAMDVDREVACAEQRINRTINELKQRERIMRVEDVLFPERKHTS